MFSNSSSSSPTTTTTTTTTTTIVIIIGSARQTMTDFDNLISPGAQAENDPVYREARRRHGRFSCEIGDPPDYCGVTKV